ncbi:hypothetical protein PIB30_048019 [Stylosanthes scabra]|uniref:PUM-HD domain-containing protein n=1 Tax=Stylosanthes scabra TaxID=79078 RepID=A0ABU6XEX8_9FABA|nr:hypothetical protein [Stylosanthes scabra]
MASNNYTLSPNPCTSQPNCWWLNTNNSAVEDLDSAMGGLSLSMMSQGRNSAAATTSTTVDPHEDILLTYSTLEEGSSSGHGNQHVLNNYNNNTGSILQGAPLVPSHDDYYDLRIEQDTNYYVGQSSSVSRVEGIRGHVVELARDQCGCRFLQMIIDTGTPQEVEMILDEVKDQTHELMTHHFGNYLIEKIFESRNLSTHQIQTVHSSIITDQQQLMHVCMNDHGLCVQDEGSSKMLLNLRNPKQIAASVIPLKFITVPLLKNANGGYVIQQCIKLFTPTCQTVIFREIVRDCIDVATDKNGCSVIQKCMDHAAGGPIRLLIESIILSSTILSTDPYGNILEPPVIEMIISQLRGRYVELSINRHASHVIEELFRYSEPHYAGIIIKELVNSPEFLKVLQDLYGNYVVQRALEYSKPKMFPTEYKLPSSISTRTTSRICIDTLS